MFLLNKWKMQPQLWILIRKTCYLMEISQENFCIFNRFFPTQNNGNSAVEKSSVSTQSIHTNPFSQPISFDGQSHCLPPLHTSTLTAISLTSNMHGLSFSCLHHVTSSPTAHFMYYHHMQRHKRTSGLRTSFTVHVLYKHFYCHVSTTLP